MTARAVCSQYEAINRRDFELMLSRCHPEVELVISEIGIAGLPIDLDPVYAGREALRRFFEQWVREWEDYRIEPDEVIDTSGDCLIMLGRQRGHGRRSGVEIDQPIASVFTLRNGLCVRIEDFWEHAQALEAAGLSE